MPRCTGLFSALFARVRQTDFRTRVTVGFAGRGADRRQSVLRRRPVDDLAVRAPEAAGARDCHGRPRTEPYPLFTKSQISEGSGANVAPSQ